MFGHYPILFYNSQYVNDHVNDMKCIVYEHNLMDSHFTFLRGSKQEINEVMVLPWLIYIQFNDSRNC